MKKLRYYAYLYASILLVFASCSKDKGSYDYIEVNKLTLLDQDGKEIINRDYSIRYGRELRIIPKIVASAATWDENNIKYTWILNKDTISNENKLILNTIDVGVGTKLGKLIITDNSTSISYSANFKVIIAAGISKGSFILTEDESFQSTLVLRDINTEEDYLYLNQFNNIKLGKYPLNLNIGSTAKSATNVEYRRAVLTTKEGEYPIMAVDLSEFSPSILYPMLGATVNGELLVPSYSWINPAKLSTNNIDGIVLIDGKCYNTAQGIISGDVYAYDPLNYYFAADAVCPSRILYGSFVAGFDIRNQRIRVFGNNLKGDGMFTLNYDNITNPNLTQGHTFVAVSEIFDNDLRWQFLTRKNTTIFMHNATMDIGNYPYKLKSVTTLASKEVPEMVNAVDFKISGSYWYFAKGRTIYQFSVNGLDISAYLTLPDDGSGDIVAWNFNINAASNYSKMGIATYNAATNKTYKGSYYLYDILSNSYDSQELNVIDKAVEVQIGL